MATDPGWYPQAVRQQLTVPNRARNKTAMRRPVRINLHTAVSNSTSLYPYFNSTGAGGVFSHFYVGKTGIVYQYQSTAFMASCDLDGNPDTISIETWDGYRTGYPGYWNYDSDVPPWNAAQVASLARLLGWLYETHPSIPRKLATDNRRGSSSHGLSYHRLGVVGAPGFIPRTEGGLTYSTSRGKVCPGVRRTAQIPALFRSITNPGLPSAGDQLPTEDDDMAMTPAERAALIADIAEASRARIFEQRMTGPEIDPDQKPTLHDYLVRALPAHTAAAVHRQWLGSSGPTIGTAIQSTYGLVQELASRAGVDIDEVALAQELAASILPTLTAALAAKLDGVGGVDPQQLAREVVAELGAQLRP